MTFIAQIGTILVSLLQIVLNFITGLYQLIDTIPTVLTMLTYSVAQLPPVLLIYATAFISISVVFLVIDR